MGVGVAKDDIVAVLGLYLFLVFYGLDAWFFWLGDEGFCGPLSYIGICNMVSTAS